MKNLKSFSVLVIFSLLIISCSTEESSDISNQAENESVEVSKKKNKVTTTSTSSRTKIIESSEVPQFPKEFYKFLGFKSFISDVGERNTLLDIENSTLKIPFDNQQSIYLGIEPNSHMVSFLGIIIAKYHIDNDEKDDCSQCVNCLGFTCSFRDNNGLPQLTLDYSYVSSSNYNEAVNNLNLRPKNRQQPVEFIVNREDGYVEFHFFADIDWNYIASSN